MASDAASQQAAALALLAHLKGIARLVLTGLCAPPPPLSAATRPRALALSLDASGACGGAWLAPLVGGGRGAALRELSVESPTWPLRQAGLEVSSVEFGCVWFCC